MEVKFWHGGGNEFFVVMTVQQDKAPNLKISGAGLGATVTLGQQQIHWRNNRLLIEAVKTNVPELNSPITGR